MKRINRYLLGCVTVAATLSGFSACSSENGPDGEKLVPNERKNIELSATTRAVAENLRDYYMGFTADAVRYVDAHPEKGRNVIVSPLSASILLGMVANGVEGEAMEAICRYLGTDDLDGLNSLASQLLTELPVIDNETKLTLSNAIWVNEKYHLSSDFTSAMAATYKPTIEYGDFENNSQQVKDDIFKWCDKETNGLIPEINLDIKPNMMSVLLNAMYFKGIWNKGMNEQGPFNKKNTRKENFHGVDGTKKVDMMNSDELEGEGIWTDEYTAFRLHFGNGAFSYTVLLPDEGLTDEQALDLLTPEKFGRVGSMSRANLILKMPKFKVSSDLSLNNVFEDTDMSVLNRETSFTMFDPNERGEMKIGQSAIFSVDENGAEGAAVTYAGFELTCVGPLGAPRTIIVDRPFFFFINEVSTGACVLSGRIATISNE